MKYQPLQSGKYYHIFNQGNNGEDIFIEEENYGYFLKLLQKHIIPVASVLSYCLLKNHFHLLVQIREMENEKDISKAFSNLFNAYAKAINKKYNRKGSLFRDRFKRIQIDNVSYLQQLIIYININPVYHQFVNNVSEYKHSSYFSLISDKPTLLARTEVINLFENRNNFIAVLTQQKATFDEKVQTLILE